MKSNQSLYIQAFWKTALLWVMTNKNACSTWLPDEEVLRKIRIFNASTNNWNVAALNHALNNYGLMGWINGVCDHVSKVLYVAKNRKYIKQANGEILQAFFYLISFKPIVSLHIPKNIEVYQEAWDQNQSTNQHMKRKATPSKSKKATIKEKTGVLSPPPNSSSFPPHPTTVMKSCSMITKEQK